MPFTLLLMQEYNTLQEVKKMYPFWHSPLKERRCPDFMTYSGDGLAFETPLPANSNTTTALEAAEQRSQSFELPSLVNIGRPYDFYLAKDSGSKSVHRITVAVLIFTSNSFTEDQEMLGIAIWFSKKIF